MKSHVPVADKDAWPRIVKFMKDNPQTLMSMISNFDPFTTNQRSKTENKATQMKRDKKSENSPDRIKPKISDFLDKNEYLNKPIMEDMDSRKGKLQPSSTMSENYPPIIDN